MRFRRGEMRGELVCVISNHPELRDFCESMDLPFHYVDLRSHPKVEAEEVQLALLQKASSRPDCPGPLHANSERAISQGGRSSDRQYSPQLLTGLRRRDDPTIRPTLEE